MTLGNGVISGMDNGIESNIINGFMGDIAIVSNKEKSDNILFKMYGEAINTIPNYKEIKNILLKESYIALHAGSLRLATMGARSLLDMYMNEILGDVGGFAQKLNLLVERGYVSRQHKDILTPALEAGHAVTHRGHRPMLPDVNLVFDIVENLLHTWVLSKKSEGMKSRIPKRKQ